MDGDWGAVEPRLLSIYVSSIEPDREVVTTFVCVLNDIELVVGDYFLMNR